MSAALLAREKTGNGQHVRRSMLDTVLSFMWASDMGGLTFVDHPITHQEAASFIDLIYETADGYMTVSTMSDKQWAGLARAFGQPELEGDPRFKTPELRDRNLNERLALIQEVLKTRTTQEWLEIFEREDVPRGPALTRHEVIGHPQVVASEILVEHEHPVAGRVRQTRVPARFEGTPPDALRGAPKLGEHNTEILAELGYGEAEIESLRESGALDRETGT